MLALNRNSGLVRIWSQALAQNPASVGSWMPILAPDPNFGSDLDEEFGPKPRFSSDLDAGFGPGSRLGRLPMLVSYPDWDAILAQTWMPALAQDPHLVTIWMRIFIEKSKSVFV
jgi:hypothetical protein